MVDDDQYFYGWGGESVTKICRLMIIKKVHIERARSISDNNIPTNFFIYLLIFHLLTECPFEINRYKQKTKKTKKNIRQNNFKIPTRIDTTGPSPPPQLLRPLPTGPVHDVGRYLRTQGIYTYTFIIHVYGSERSKKKN